MEINSNSHLIATVLVKNRVFFLINIVGISIVAFIYAFFFAPVVYTSQLSFLPPITNTSLPIALPKNMPMTSPLSSSFDPEQLLTLFTSKSLSRKVINRFDLISYYKLNNDKNNFEKAMRRLSADLLLSCNEKTSSLNESKIISFTLTAFHRSPDTASLLVTYAFSLIDSTVQAINKSRARRERRFIEVEIAKKRRDIDSLQEELLRFKQSTKAYDPPQQLAMTFNTLAHLKATTQAIEMKMQRLNLEYYQTTPEIMTLQKTLSSYTAAIASLEHDISPSVIPSLDYAAAIIPEYYKIVQDIKIQNDLLVFLSSEGEKAKLNESKSVSQLFVTDASMRPEYKAKPKRGLLIGKIIVLYLFFCIILTLYYDFYDRRIKGSPFFKSLFSGTPFSPIRNG